MQKPSRACQMNPSSQTNLRLAKGVTACQRCRRRKQKCDLKLPNCSNCEGAHAPCLTYHSGKGAEVPRNYVTNLETQVEKLQKEIQELQSQRQPNLISGNYSTSPKRFSPAVHELNATPTEIRTNPDVDTNHLQVLTATQAISNAVVEPSSQPRFLGASSGLTLAKMVMASIRTETMPSSPVFPKSTSRVYPAPSTSASVFVASVESTLPPRYAADHLVDVYFQYRTPHLPIMERYQVEPIIESAYLFMNGNQPADQSTERNLFTTYMIFAIALCNVPNPAGGTGRVLQSEGCFRSAIGWVEKVIAYSKSDLETLRAVLLLAQFVSMCPWQGSLWHLTGIALRLSIDLGLHWESETQAVNTSAELLYERRRLWYSAYQFDRILGITLGRPFGIADESIRVSLPNPWAASRRRLGPSQNFDIHHQQAHNHLFSMAKLESEIKHVQQSQTWVVKIANPKPNFAMWVEDIQPRLQEWYSTIPNPGKAHSSSIFASQTYWDSIYNNALLQLYRPNSSIQHLPPEALSISHEAACNLILNIKMLQREGRLDVLWRSVHHLFMAGLTVIYGLWQSKEIRDGDHISSSISTLQSCGSTLSAMSENFSGATGCRDVFDTLSKATIDWLVTNDEERMLQNRMEFDKQVEDLLKDLQSPGTGLVTGDDNSANDISTMLSTDLFGEMLSSAAQWPELQGMDYNDMGPLTNEFWYQQPI
ncbi:hypothetical protein EJ08DRAFT_332714 [Tothia fuscella]|uniref:Zn(2)-C6 fungal-type domain-containing protein n=1 Tax=Tothia fuscella TaxID=1048955 RepID=A0A9P4NMP3_9PEZI|nr:hypothetical protein EJ08DRAFT_332714 [Tothia fuscella]